MPQGDINQTYKSNEVKVENVVPNKLNAVEFRGSDPTNLSANPMRIWARTDTSKLKWTVDGVNINETATKADLVTTNTIEVGTGKQFTTITAAVNSITDNSSSNRYDIKVYPGTYAERIVLKPYVGVTGVNRETVIFEWNRPTTTPDADVSGQSMVELHDDGTYIKNITVKGTNFRYMIHTEFATNSNRSVLVDNCHVEHNGNDPMYTWANPHAWGVGLGVNNTRISTYNSRFIGYTNGRALLVHDNANPTGSSFVVAENNTFLSDGGTVYYGINLDNYSLNTGSVPWYATFNNNHIQVGIEATTSGNTQRCRISGGGNSMQVYYAGNWVDSSAGCVILNSSASTIAQGTAVIMNTNERSISGVMNGTNYSSYSLFLGFTLEDIPASSYGRVCYKGDLGALFNSTSNFADELMLDTNGQVIKYDSTTAGRRPVIGQQIQAASATVGSRRQIRLRGVIGDVIPFNVLKRGDTYVTYAWGGAPLNVPAYAGQIARDSVNGNIWIGIGASTTADWVRLQTL